VGDKFKHASSWVQDYFDRRGQAFHVRLYVVPIDPIFC
jgi:hypothetical protein